MTETSTDEEKKTLGISQQVAEQQARHIVPIFMKDERGRFRSWGSGFLVSNGNVSFLVSAAHVFDPLARNNDLCIYVGTSKLHHLSGNLFLTPMVDNNRDDDLVDIGVLRLLPVASPPYPEVGKEAIAIDAPLPLSLPRGQKHYALVGFPGSKTKVCQPGRFMRSEPCAVQNVSASEKEYRSIVRNEQEHIVMRFDPRKVSWPHQPGKASHAFPDPHGMSGSPLWWIYRPEVGDSAQARIVGVANRYGRKLLTSTDIKVALDMIAKMSA